MNPNSPSILFKTILVTGAAGFIGSHVSEQLVRLGCRVIGIDNLNDYYDPKIKQENLTSIENTALEYPGSFEFRKLDIRDKEAVDALLTEFSIESIIHLAAMAGVRYSQEYPELYLDVNLNGTLVLLELARKHQIKNFTFASTSSVYGYTKVIPFVETDNCDKPLAPYPMSKRAAEMLCYSYHHLYKLNINVLRFFTVYGPRGRPDMMAYKVLDNIFYNREVPLYNGGDMHRDWTYIGDISDGVVRASQIPTGFTVMNLGRGEPVYLKDFVQEIEHLAGKPSHLKPAPMMAADIPYSFADITVANKTIGYQPTVSFKEGINHLWLWYKENRISAGSVSQ